MINPAFAVLFAIRDVYDSVILSSPLSFVAGLDGILCSDSPPSLEFFRCLPAPPALLVWGIYAFLLEKVGAQALLYIGSGTNTDKGIKIRLNQYFHGSGSFSIFMTQAIEAGYHISHKGLL